jgi:DNA replication protein DnaC
LTNFSNEIADPKPDPDWKPWSDFDRKRHPQVESAVDDLIAWYREEQGAIILFGHPGCGKTHMAKTVARAYGAGAKLYPEPKLLEDIRAGYAGQGNPQIIESLLRMKLLLLDDVGAAHVKESSLPWLHSIYWRILDACLDKSIPLLITTNLEPGQLFDWVGPRAEDRLFQLVGKQENLVNMFDVPSFRREWAGKNRAEID